MADEDKLFNLIKAGIVMNSLNDKPVIESTTWPGKYKYSIMFRMGWSIFTIIYINMVLEQVFLLGPNYLSYFWCLPIGFIPLLGSYYTPILCALLILGGVPTDQTFTKEYQIKVNGYPTCFSPGCDSK